MEHAVRFDFWFSLWNSLSIPTAVAVTLGGLVSGYLAGALMRREATPIHAARLAALATTALAGLQVTSIIGQAASNTTYTTAYVGGHLGFLVLSVLYGAAVGPGVRVYKWRVDREEEG